MSVNPYQDDDDSMSTMTLETLPDLGMEADEFGDLNGIVIEKKYKEMKEKAAN